MRNSDVLKAFRMLSDTLEMIEDALLVVAQGLKMNPTVDERHDLEGQQHELSIEKMKVVAAMKAIGRGQLVIPPPTEAQITAVKRLARDVDDLTRANVTAGNAVVAGGQVLDAVGKIKLA
jgi:hypothetical protein